MERATRENIATLLPAGILTVGLYWLGGYPSLALVTGVCWACGLKLTFHTDRLYPTFTNGVAWRDRRWAGLGIGVVVLAALVGVSPMLPVPNELRLGLGLLVTGAGITAYVAGTLAVLERVDGPTTAEPASDSPYPADAE